MSLILDSLSSSCALGERGVKASLPEKYHGELAATLVALAETGAIITDGPASSRKYRLRRNHD